jgi:hypothetical protein
VIGGLRATDLGAAQVDALIVPESACGGSAVLSLSQTSTQIIAVAENQTRMQVTPASLGISVITVSSYLEAIGSLVAHRAGLDPQALRTSVPPLTESRWPFVLGAPPPEPPRLSPTLSPSMPHPHPVPIRV